MKLRTQMYRLRLGAVGVIGLIVSAGPWSMSALAQEIQEPPFYAVRNAHISLGNGEVIEQGTLVLEDGLITAVGTNVTVPPHAWVIEGDGLHVYPGLIDSLTDIGLAQPARPRNGNGQEAATSRNEQPFSTGPEDRPGTFTWRAAADHLDADDERIRSWRSAGFTSAITAHKEGIFPGQASFINLGAGKGEALVVQTPTAFPVRLSEPGGFRGYPGSLMGVIAYIKQVFADTEHYGQAWAAYRRDAQGRARPHYDRTLEPLVEAVSAQTPVMIPAVWKKEIARALDIGNAIGSRVVIYGAHDAYNFADELKQADASVLVSANWPKPDPDANPEAEIPLRVLRLRDRAPATPQALAEAGVRFAFYSDGAENARSFLENVKKSVELGLDQQAAIRALSLSAAEIAGLEDRLGSLEVGKIGNVVVTQSGLFEDGMKIHTVFVDGQRFTPDPPDEEREEREEPKRSAQEVHR